MYRVDAPGSVPVMPTPAEAGAPGYYSDGDPAEGRLATVIPADHLNAMQEEIASVVEAAGIVLNKTEDNQLLSAIKAFSGTPFVPVTLQTTNSAKTKITSISIEDGDVVRLTVDVIGRKSDGSAMYCCTVIKDFYKNSGADIAGKGDGSEIGLVNDEDWGGLTLDVNILDQTVDVNVTGAASTTINWSVSIKMSKLLN